MLSEGLLFFSVDIPGVPSARAPISVSRFDSITVHSLNKRFARAGLSRPRVI